MKRFYNLQFFFLCFINCGIAACNFNTSNQAQTETKTSPAAPQIKAQVSPAPAADSSIRKIDFKNFTFPGTEDYAGKFTLKNGEKPYEHGKEDGIDLDKTEYFDVTGDKEEEAVLRMSIQTGGTAMPNLIYIYTLKNKKPKLLWGFITGDRANGGFKSIYAENGELIVELFGKNKFVKDKWENEDDVLDNNGACCPTRFTRSRLKWNGEKFVLKSNPEVFPYERELRK
jgi:hypothetical protein